MSDYIVIKECRAFQWIGQSIETCDGCGKPIFDHDGDAHSYGGPFSGSFLLKPFDEAVIANWIMNEWIDRQRAAYLLTVKEEIIVTEQITGNQVVIESQQHGTQHDNTGTDEEYIEHLLLKLDKADDQIELLRKELKVCQAERDHHKKWSKNYEQEIYNLRDQIKIYREQRQ